MSNCWKSHARAHISNDYNNTIHDLPLFDEDDDFGFRSLGKRLILSPVGLSFRPGPGTSVVWSSEFR